jgi:general secretion pathway protein I
VRSSQVRTQISSGFTLIEVLVALAILSIALGVIVAGLRNTAAGVETAVEQSECLIIAKSLLASEGRLLPLQYGDISGTTVDGYHWDISTKPWGNYNDTPERLMGAYLIEVWVSHNGRTAALSTLQAGPVDGAN